MHLVSLFLNGQQLKKYFLFRFVSANYLASHSALDLSDVRDTNSSGHSGVSTFSRSLDSKATSLISAQIQALTKEVIDFERKSLDMEAKLTAQVQDGLNINTKLSGQVQTLTARLHELEQNMIRQFRLLRIDRSRYDVSDIYSDSVYAVSKSVGPFSIASDNNYCAMSGGYLVEIDDLQEYNLVLKLVSNIGGAEDFLTGGNDIHSEGHFVYYHSKKPVPRLPWKPGQPNNYDGVDDCMGIQLNDRLLNDRPCYSGWSGKYVCEIPLN